jgi:hypothetical protein
MVGDPNSKAVRRRLWASVSSPGDLPSGGRPTNFDQAAVGRAIRNSVNEESKRMSSSSQVRQPAAPSRTGLAAVSRAGGWLAALAVVLVVSLVAAPSASAVKQIEGFIGGPQPSLSSPAVGGVFNNLRDVAVYEGSDGDPSTDKIFVVDSASDHQRIQRLDAAGNFERMWGKDVIRSGRPGDAGTGYEICTAALDCQAPSAGSTGSLGGEFNNPLGIAVNQSTGHVYVMDRTNSRVQEFDLDGNFVRAFGKGVGGPGVDVCSTAGSCLAGTAGAGAGQLGSSTQSSQVAIHPVTGDVFVMDSQNRRVLQFTSAGVFIRAWGYNVSTAVGTTFEVCVAADCQAAAAGGNPNGNLATNPLRLAVDSNGIVYVGDVSGAAAVGGANRVVRFDSDLAPGAPGDASAALHSPIACCAPTANAPLVTGTTLGIKIDADSDAGGPDEETVVVLRRNSSGGATTVQSFDIPTTPGDPITTALENAALGSVSSVTALGVGSSPTSFYYVAVGGTIGGSSGQAGLLVLAPPGGPLSSVAGPAADVTASSATVTGIAGAGGSSASYRFEVSENGVSWEPADVKGYVAGSAAAPVAATLTGLGANTLYRVRLVVTKVTGTATTTSVVSGESIFVTDAIAPEVFTDQTTQRTATGAQLVGRVNPNGSETTYFFEYGKTAAYGQEIPVPSASAGDATSAQLVTQQIAGLEPETTYHYRIVATNDQGTSHGVDRTFTTRTNAPGVGDRAYELVSPADKVGGVGVGSWYAGLGSLAPSGVAAYTEERFAPAGDLGSTLVDGPTSYAADWALAERGPSGWVSRPAMRRASLGDQTYRWLQLKAASESLDLMAWSTQAGRLDPFEEMTDWSLDRVVKPWFTGDWSGRWEIFGPTDLAQVPVGTGVISRAELAGQISSDGSHIVGSSGIRGLAGTDDPSHPTWSDQVFGSRTTYVDDLSGGVSDSFPGAGVRENVGTCQGGTGIPERLANGKLQVQQCPTPSPTGPTAALISSRGTSIDSSGIPATTTPGSIGIALLGNSLERVVSANGSRIFFMSPDPLAPGVPNGVNAFCTGTGTGTLCPPQLYVRQENQDGTVTTRLISQAVAGLLGSQDATLTGKAVFEGASEDGDKVLFRTNSPLTADDRNGTGAAPVTTGSASSSSWDLYLYDLPDGPDGDPATPDGDPAGGELVRVSAGPDGDGDCNSPLGGDGAVGALRFVSSDASRLYFTCATALPSVGGSSNGTVTEPGGTATTQTDVNLYSYSRDGGQESWRFVGRLPRTTGGEAATCATTGVGRGAPVSAAAAGAGGGLVGFVPFVNCVQGTDDGAFVTFFSPGQLTVDDPDGVSGDIYAYDADADELTRITAAQGGEGEPYPCGTDGTSSVTPCYGDGGLDDPLLSLPILGVATAPDVSGDRVAFFQSASRLVAGDVDDQYDVYQWRNGKLSLVSTGASDTEGAFLKGNEANGRNVYFATFDRLSWQDHDSVADIYTARVGGGIAQPTPPPVCLVLSDACQSAGGGSVVAVVPKTPQPGGGDAQAGARQVLSLAAVGARARARAARSGVLAVRVTSTAAGRVSAVARGRIGRKSHRLGKASVRLRRPGAAVLRVRLSWVARQRLRAGRKLRLQLTVTGGDARRRSMSVVLRRMAR